MSMYSVFEVGKIIEQLKDETGIPLPENVLNVDFNLDRSAWPKECRQLIDILTEIQNEYSDIMEKFDEFVSTLQILRYARQLSDCFLSNCEEHIWDYLNESYGEELIEAIRKVGETCLADSNQISEIFKALSYDMNAVKFFEEDELLYGQICCEGDFDENFWLKLQMKPAEIRGDKVIFKGNQIGEIKTEGTLMINENGVLREILFKKDEKLILILTHS